MLTHWLFDIDFIEEGDFSFSSEYIKIGNLHQINLYSPWHVIQIKAKFD
jgi:hypothetical protein